MAIQESADGSSPDEAEPTVLFVDDDPQLTALYEAQYSAEFTVVTATSGETALQEFGDHIDFAFFDRRMPDLRGEEVIREVRNEGYETPVGIISAVDAESNLSVDPDVYLTKPPSVEQVTETVLEHWY
jgi:DNA-binding response OmpR family regulator